MMDGVLMMIGNNIHYIKAYTEVKCLLEYLPQSYIDRLPKKLIELIKRQSNEQYKINIDINKSLLEQNFSKKTKELIAVIKYNYWSTYEERQQLKNKFYENEKRYQTELLEKYNPNDIFKKKESKTDLTENIESNLQMVEYNEIIFRRIINKIKRIFIKI